MKINHVNFARGFRGGERQTLNLMWALARLGIRQTLICRTGSTLKERAEALGFDVMPTRHPLLGHFGAPPADITHVHEARGAYWAAIEHFVLHTPYIITRRVPNPISNSLPTRSVYRNAKALFGVSSDVSTRLSQQVGRNVRTVLSCATQYRPSPASVAAIRRELGDGPVIGHVGAFVDRHKGQSVLLEAFNKLVAEFPQARLLFVGDGPDRAELERLAKGDRRIRFAGFQTDVGPWIAAMDIFAFPSREEGLGSSVLDAMALGVPVVVSPVGGLLELTGTNQRGLVIERLDAESLACSIRALLCDSTLRQQLVAEARTFALRHDADEMARQYMQVYHAILAQQMRNLGWIDA